MCDAEKPAYARDFALPRGGVVISCLHATMRGTKPKVEQTHLASLALPLTLTRPGVCPVRFHLTLCKWIDAGPAMFGNPTHVGSLNLSDDRLCSRPTPRRPSGPGPLSQLCMRDWVRHSRHLSAGMVCHSRLLGRASHTGNGKTSPILPLGPIGE